MTRRKKIMLAAGILLAAGTVAAISAGGPDGWRQRHGGDGSGMGYGMGGRHGFGPQGFGPMGGDDMGGRRGMFGRGNLTKDEFETRARERFARIDKNGDGVLDLAEIEAALAAGAEGRRGFMGRERGGDPSRRIASMLGGKDGKTTRQQALDTAARLFDEMDLDRDGRITDADLPPMMRGRGGLAGREGQGMGRGPLGDLAREAAGADGTISKDAFLAAAGRRFDRFDRNRDGTIDSADFAALRKETVDYQVKRFLHRFGATGSDKVTREQFMARSAERFARLDANGDGVVTSDERPFGRHMEDGRQGGMRERMRGWWGGEGRQPSGGPAERGPAPGMPPQPPRN